MYMIILIEMKYTFHYQYRQTAKKIDKILFLYR
jgi:hypothetical protein